jgi:hypothetical protein
MRGILAGCILVAVALAGCTVRYSAQERASGLGGTATSQGTVSGGSPLGNAIIVGVMLADGVHYYRLGPDGKTSVRAPEPDPTRRINAQDCTRPVDPYAGNLLCR